MSDHERASSPRVAVLDIDGVLADVRHRLHHIDGPRRDWDAFFSAVSADPVLDEGRAVALGAVSAGLGIVYLTGRPERCRLDTVQWLAAQGLPDGELMMRPDADRRPARVMKVEALRRLSGTREVASLVDDDPEVLSAAASAGFPVVAAEWLPRGDTGGASVGDALRDAQETLGRS